MGYSRAVKVKNLVFVSGTTGYDYSTMTISDYLLDQTEQCLNNIIEALSKPCDLGRCCQGTLYTVKGRR
ncbi:Rid family hydrolase [Flagellimonas olearia]|uniref:Rid family hydrolase n=1 Tax=Flagellimonas olearia TaxID=552546 RepID=UPI001B8608F5